MTLENTCADSAAGQANSPLDFASTRRSTSTDDSSNVIDIAPKPAKFAEARSTSHLTTQPLPNPGTNDGEGSQASPQWPEAASQIACHPSLAGPDGNLPSLPAVALLTVLWRSSGVHYQIGMMDRHLQQFRNLPVTNVEAALKRAGELSDAGCDAYFAPAEYNSKANRTAINVADSWAFWGDIDCGPGKAATGKGYEDTDQAHAALQRFCVRTGIPAPTHMVDSGGGLHAYWAVDRPIAREAWQQHASKLKALANACAFLADPSRTADIASVLRVPGTLNYKYTPPRPVRLVKAGEQPLERDKLLQAISDAYERLCGATTPVPADHRPAANDANLNGPAEAPAYGPPDLAKLSSALKCLDPDCGDETWKLRRLAPMAKVAREHPELADRTQALARSWSSGELRGKPSTAWVTPGASNDITGEAEFDKAWRRFLNSSYSGQSATLGTIYHDAAQAGWTDQTESFQLIDTPAPVDTRELLIEQANNTLKAMLTKVESDDVGAPLEPENVAALTLLFTHSQADYLRARDRLKVANKRVSLTALDAAVKAGVAKTQTALTHHGYATDTVARLTVNGWRPVAHEGTLYVLDPERNIWLPMAEDQVVQVIANAHDGKDNCTRRSDYTGIAQHAIALVSSESFFAEAPVGLACRDGFYRIVGDQPQVEPLRPAHRQRVLLDVALCDQAKPLFDAFLRETYKSVHEGEESQQIALVQEIAGAIMLGLMHRHQKAVLFYDPFGRAGKGTLESILRHLVPTRFVTAVSPFVWNREYFVVTLAGARLNVVGELPDNESLPAAIFKSVIGGDLITGRNPTHRPITFKNGAAHVFMSNHMINSRDQSEAFFARWVIVEFPNSRLVSGLPLDPMLAQRIIEQELPGIAQWALVGATRLLRNNAFSRSSAHDRLMQQWRRCNSSLDEFIHESCDLGTDHQVRRSALYRAYKSWCGDNGRKHFAKARVKELLEHNVGLGITLALRDGHEIFLGVQLKPVDESDAFDL